MSDRIFVVRRFGVAVGLAPLQRLPVTEAVIQATDPRLKRHIAFASVTVPHIRGFQQQTSADLVWLESVMCLNLPRRHRSGVETCERRSRSTASRPPNSEIHSATTLLRPVTSVKRFQPTRKCQTTSRI